MRPFMLRRIILFRSRSHQVIISSHPNRTKDNYGFNADLLTKGNILESLRQEDVSISSVRRMAEPLVSQAPALRHQGVNASSTEAFVEVKMLTLQPHHWYFAQGVRVHNMGTSRL